MRVVLTGGAYTARSLIANAQRCVNLYGEMNPKDSPVPMTYYPRAGLKSANISPTPKEFRCLYTATNGQLYGVVGRNVYTISSSYVFTLIGSIFTYSSQCYMMDNGIVMILVDGSTTGYAIDFKNGNTFGIINDPGYLGADFVDYIDSFFVFNQPGTQNFYASLSNINYDMLITLSGSIQSATISGGITYTDGTYNGEVLSGGHGTGAKATIIVSGGSVTTVTLTNTGQDYQEGDILTAVIPAGSGFQYTITGVSSNAFDPLFIAAKTGYADNLVGLVCVHREIWLIGELTTEVWYDAGTPDFPFGALPGVFINHGCIAKYSIATQDVNVYWLGQDKQGERIVFKRSGYAAQRISTHAIENEWDSYGDVSDAIGFTYQQEGHAFYVLQFPSANKTWAYDESTKEWHELAATDPQGDLMRHWSNCCAAAYNQLFMGDFQNGTLYVIDQNSYTDNGNPIEYIRGFPHLLGDRGERVFFDQFIADMEVGTDDGMVDNSSQIHPPVISLRWSDDRGVSFGNKVTQSLGALGQYRTSIQWRRLGMARDRVFELSWSCPTKTALNGAFLTMRRGGT